MKFESAFRQLRKGKMIGRKHWKPETFWHLKDGKIMRPLTGEGFELVVAYIVDLLAEDWVVKEMEQ